MTDIQIAQRATMQPMDAIAAKLGLTPSDWIPYGRHNAKITRLPDPNPRGNLILVTAMTPTPAGEGKTTVSVGLADGLALLGEKTVLCLREPSLGPVFGMKGGAAGGGYAQVVPMEDINLHFTGDLHAVTAANNLLAAAIDNHLHFGNALGIDSRKITWRRCMDMNDRTLRDVVVGLGGAMNGVPRECGFDITAASEVMAVLCLAESLGDLRTRLGRIVVGTNTSGDPVTCGDLHVEGAMTTLLQHAFFPNLAQTLEHTPTLIHGGPFANIAHGCNSLIATRLGLSLGDWVVTEAGFGADLGAEKFLDIKCRVGGIYPSAVVLVATIRACKSHGGYQNLDRHIDNLRDVYGVPVVVAVNQFATDTAEELDALFAHCAAKGVPAAVADGFQRGGNGCMDLARTTLQIAQPAKPTFSYPLELPLADKINAIAAKIYRADGVEYTPAAKKDIDALTAQGFGGLPVCMAKTQYSFSDNPKKLGAPSGFTICVRSVQVRAGAGFVVALTGEIMTMPGLPRHPAYEAVDCNADGVVMGLF